MACASRIVSTLTPENAAKVVEFAETHTAKQIELEMARRAPKRSQTRPRFKIVGADRVLYTFEMSMKDHENLERSRSVQAKRNLSCDMPSTFSAALDTHLDVHDPVRKADRSVARKKAREAAGNPASENQASRGGET